jgi:hypothetical protein
MDKYHIIVILLFILSILSIKRTLNPRNDSVNRGYGTTNESIKTLLDRTQWSNHYTGRIPIYFRFLLYAIFITFATNIIFTDGKANGKTFIQSVMVIWIILIMLSSYFSHHADKFSSYCINENLNNIRKRLAIESYDHENACKYLSANKNPVDGRHGCFAFFYNVK